ncbi:MAG: hypothetical protein K2W33_11975, partial [Burkholderiales bacterium]|nr:hypothetical protein [Burkholderiales bacterium]
HTKHRARIRKMRGNKRKIKCLGSELAQPHSPTAHTLNMAYNTIYFQNPQTGQTRRAPVGYAWTLLCFGPFVFLARKEWLLFLITLVLTVVTLHISNIVLSFKANRMYIQMLINQGYRVARVQRGSVERMSKKLGIPLPSLSSFLFAETKVAFR